MTDTPKEPNVQSEREFDMWFRDRVNCLLLTEEMRGDALYIWNHARAALESRTPIPAQAGEREALPPLPYTEYVLATCESENERAYFTCDEGYSESQMREYARAALASRAAAQAPAQTFDQWAERYHAKPTHADQIEDWKRCRMLAQQGWDAALAGQASTQAPAEPEGLARNARNLVKRASRMLDDWANHYGRMSTEVLPPEGQVRLQEDISEFLAAPAPVVPTDHNRKDNE